MCAVLISAQFSVVGRIYLDQPGKQHLASLDDEQVLGLLSFFINYLVQRKVPFLE